jgi:hypothetical protein
MTNLSMRLILLSTVAALSFSGSVYAFVLGYRQTKTRLTRQNQLQAGVAIRGGVKLNYF